MAFLRGLSVSKFGFGKVFVPSIASYSRVFGREDFSALRGKFEAISVNVAKQGVSAVEKVVQYQYSNDSRFSMVDEVIRLIKKYSLLFSRFGKHIQSTFLNYMKTYNSFHATKLFCCFAATSLLFNTVQCSTDNVKNVSNNDNLNASFVEPAVHAIPVFEDALLVQRIGAWIFDTILYTFLIAIGNVPLALLRVPQTLIIACTFVAPFLLDFLFHKINGDSPGIFMFMFERLFLKVRKRSVFTL